MSGADSFGVGAAVSGGGDSKVVVGSIMVALADKEAGDGW